MSCRNSLKNTQIIILAYLLASSFFDGGKASAQLIPDGTLGTENSIVVPLNSLIDQVQGGAIRGGNLFHSFSEFNVGKGRSVYFANPATVTNILTRVTGINPSNIFGILGVGGDANLILINPNGINFGPDASLDLRGSFTATTADGIDLGEDAFFSATDTENSSLLSIQPGALFNNALRDYQAQIKQEGDLVVRAGETITLFSDRVNLTGSLIAPGGRVEVLGDHVALVDNAHINISSPNGGGTVLIGGELQGKGNTPTASHTFVGKDVTIAANATVNGDGGEVIVWADQSTAFYGNISARGGVEGGDGGFVEVSGKESLVYGGEVDTSAVTGSVGTLLLDPNDIIIKNGYGDGDDNNPLFGGAFYFGNNNYGNNGEVLAADTVPTIIYESELESQAKTTNIILQANNNIILENLADDGLDLSGVPGLIAFIADADGNGMGDFVMEDTTDSIVTGTRDIAISGANLTIGNINTGSSANSGNADKGGVIQLNANGNIAVHGQLNSSSFVNFGNAEQGGAIKLYANGDIVLHGQLNSSSSANFGNAEEGGAIDLEANGDITLKSGFEILSNGSLGGQISFHSDGNIQALEGSIVSSSNGQIFNTQGGNIRVTAQSLFLEKSRLETITLGQADAGQVLIQINNSLVLDGGVNNPSLSGIFSEVRGNNLQGNSPGIEIDTTKLEILNGAQVSASTEGGGNAGLVRVKAKDSVLITGESSQGNGSGIYSRIGVGGKGDSEGIELVTNSLELRNGGVLDTSTFGEGSAGLVAIDVKDTVLIRGESSLGNASGIYSRIGVGGKGDSEGIELATNSLEIRDGAVIDASTFDEGSAGLVKINARSYVLAIGESSQGFGSGIYSTVVTPGKGDSGGIELATNSLEIRDGAVVDVSTFGEGNAALVKIAVTDSILLTGRNSQGISSGIYSQVEGTGKGDSGGIELTTNSLEIRDGAVVTASTLGEGRADKVKITARDSISLSNDGAIATVTSGNGKEAGDITIATRRFSANSGSRLISSTDNSFNAGNINLFVTESITLAGENTGLFANTAPGSSGNSGNIFIDPITMTIRDGAQVAVNSQGSGLGGIIILFAGDLNLFNQGTITAATASSSGGNITLNVPGLVLMRNNSLISAAAGGMGDGGNINLNVGFIVAVPTENSDIIARASQGRGGDIVINADGVYGFVGDSRSLTPFSDLNASSDVVGNEGNVAVNVQFDATQGLNQLPASLVDAESLVDKDACKIEGDKIAGGSAFVVTGRGGLPANPLESLTNSNSLIEWASSESDAKSTASTTITEQKEVPYQQAQGWLISTDGKVTLTAETIEVAYSQTGMQHPSCQDVSPE